MKRKALMSIEKAIYETFSKTEMVFIPKDDFPCRKKVNGFR
jgi:hypothetical protein